MAKRFGRNQKRALREEASRAHGRTERLQSEFANKLRIYGDRESGLNAELVKARGDLRSLEDEMVNWAQRIVIHLGDESAFARTFHTKVAEPWMTEVLLGRGGWQVDVPLEPLSSSLWHPHDRSISLKASYRVVQLFAMFVEKIDDDYRMQRVIAWRIGPEDRHRLYYAIDVRTLQQIGRGGERHPLVREMQRIMTRAMMEAWASTSAGGAR
ncbi:hypothetical protein LWE61_15175 [Sphingobium sufflavum]|uniref:hypothetical protein n=1 Tax=Sphingobium sufflavum TaxID=1129547 RepID=UPI001F1622E5|nr:hypothetical protein [Sphingobium sufflavum]MCE7797891.1 hypothetical protein [Sphingobium sufflavum]